MSWYLEHKLSEEVRSSLWTASYKEHHKVWRKCQHSCVFTILLPSHFKLPLRFLGNILTLKKKKVIFHIKETKCSVICVQVSSYCGWGSPHLRQPDVCMSAFSCWTLFDLKERNSFFLPLTCLAHISANSLLLSAKSNSCSVNPQTCSPEFFTCGLTAIYQLLDVLRISHPHTAQK